MKKQKWCNMKCIRLVTADSSDDWKAFYKVENSFCVFFMMWV